MNNKQQNISILIDCDNVSYKYAEDIFNDISKYGTVNIRRAYGNWKDKKLIGWEKLLQQYNIQPIQQFSYTQGKNATDIAMIIDIMDLLYTKELTGVALVTSDSDFTPIATRILSDGLTVYGYGEEKTPSAFTNACSQFIYVENLSTKVKTQKIEELDTSAQEEYNSTTAYRGKNYDIKKDTKLKKFILNAVHQTSEDNDWSDVKDIGLYIKQNSSFSPINHGFNKLGDLIKALEAFDVAYTNDRMTMLIREKIGKYPEIRNLKDFTF
ncbi:NYN domain-containing protein [Arcobacteraceae bacterium]|nr:NYN domain-containing protein [Arcobacteraceae bacterium]